MKSPIFTKLLSTLTMTAAVTTGTFLTVAADSIDYAQDFEWTFIYDGSELPADENAIQYTDGTTGPFNDVNGANLNPEILNGVLSINTEDTGSFRVSTAQDRFLLNTDSGYTVEYRARLVETVNNTTDPEDLWAAGLQINDGREDGINDRGTVHVGLFTWPPDERAQNFAVFRATQIMRPVPIGTEFRTYTITAEGEDVAFYVDGDLVGTADRWRIVDRPEIWLANLGGEEHTSHFEVDHLKIYNGGAVSPADPEPYEWVEPEWITAWPEPAPRIVNFFREAQDFLLEFETIIGGHYRIGNRQNLNEPAELSPDTIVGDGDTVTASNEIGEADRNFYQVIRENAEISYEEAFEWDLYYEGDVDPLADNAVHYPGSEDGAMEIGHGEPRGKYRIEEGKLMMEILLPRGAFQVSAADWLRDFVIDASVGYTLEVRMRVHHSDHHGAAVLEVNSGLGENHRSSFGVRTVDGDDGPLNLIRLASGATEEVAEHPLGTGFNTFTLVGNDQEVALFMNGVEVAATTDIDTRDLGRDFIRFGSLTGQDRTARFDIDYIRAYAGGAVRPAAVD